MSLHLNSPLNASRATARRRPTQARQAATLLAPLTAADWPAVRAIFEEGIATRQATFETAAPDWATWDAARLPVGRLVARRGRAVVGWAALSPVSSRAAYRLSLIHI